MTRVSSLQIGEVARKTDVSVRTVRYYEELGLLQPSGLREVCVFTVRRMSPACALSGD